jgi:hypothetical protein
MSYEFKVNIVTGNDSFGDTQTETADEIARILQGVVDQLRVRGNLLDFDGSRLIDINGNKVGTVWVSPC